MADENIYEGAVSIGANISAVIEALERVKREVAAAESHKATVEVGVDYKLAQQPGLTGAGAYSLAATENVSKTVVASLQRVSASSSDATRNVMILGKQIAMMGGGTGAMTGLKIASAFELVGSAVGQNLTRFTSLGAAMRLAAKDGTSLGTAISAFAMTAIGKLGLGIGAATLAMQAFSREGETTIETLQRLGLAMLRMPTAKDIEGSPAAALSERVDALIRANNQGEAGGGSQEEQAIAEKIKKLQAERGEASRLMDENATRGDIFVIGEAKFAARSERFREAEQQRQRIDREIASLTSARRGASGNAAEMARRGASTAGANENERIQQQMEGYLKDQEAKRFADLERQARDRESVQERIDREVAAKAKEEERNAERNAEIKAAQDKFRGGNLRDIDKIERDLNRFEKQQARERASLNFAPGGIVGSPAEFADLLQNAIMTGAEARDRLAEQQRQEIADNTEEMTKALQEIANRKLTPVW